MIEKKRITTEECLDDMRIIPSSKGTTADEAAKFASELDNLSAEMSNNELSPGSSGEFFV